MRIDELKNTESGFTEHCHYSLSLLSNLQLYYKTADLDGKQKLLWFDFSREINFRL
jgi:hypothetical protein